MPISIQHLLSVESLHLSLMSAGADQERLTRRVTWAHNSDLLDPTPWLENGQLLLTDGLQFVNQPDPDTYAKYVQRLINADILGLVFATGVVHPTVPDQLIAACRANSMPLLSVPSSIPFVAISQYVAKAHNAEQQQAMLWSLNAQKALARAALRPDGLQAVLNELGTQLKAWVILYDANGKVLLGNEKIHTLGDSKTDVEAAVHSVLNKGMRAVSSLSTDSGDVILQTLGHNFELRGVLAVGASQPLGKAGAEVVTSVIAIASTALEQSRQLNAARMSLRNGLLELMLAGSVDIAESSSKKIWRGFPGGDMRVIATSEKQLPKQIEDELELSAENAKGRIFFARRASGNLIVIAPEATHIDIVQKLVARDLSVGVSSKGVLKNINQLIEQALGATSFCTEERKVVLFDQIYGDGLLGYINSQGGRVLAEKKLAALQQLEDGNDLLLSLRVWLENNCAWDPAAKALFVHRHTLRNRIKQIEEILKVDLSSAADRFELWSALQLTR